MTRRAGPTAVALLAIIVAGCAAISQQKTQPARPDDLHFHNLQILPQNITRDELVTTMRHFTQALGVTCDHCHAAMAGDPQHLDFPSDAKPQKAAARIMMRMTDRINRDYVSQIEEVYTTVSCWTCHRGKTQPDVVPSLPAEEHR
ncbi:MAG: hypothetical protein NVSMB68_11730 [Thermoanaerobaculia bacterium]